MFIKFVFFNDLIMLLLTICAGKKFKISTLLLKKTVSLRSFVRSLTNDLEAIVTSGACEIGSYIVVYVNIVKSRKILNTSIRSSRSLRLHKLNKFSSFSRSLKGLFCNLGIISVFFYILSSL